MEKKLKRVVCKKCYGQQYVMGAYGMKPCEECDHKGYVMIEVPVKKSAQKKAKNP